MQVYHLLLRRLFGKKGHMTMDDKTFGVYDDDGNEINPNLIVKPSLCVMCRKDDDPVEETLCLLNRIDQEGESEFQI